MTENVKTNFISQTWLVLLLAICFGALLAGMQITLGPTIEANKINLEMIDFDLCAGEEV